ncbi:MAG: hypothetical protein AUG10_06920 [Gemmatimonadetes bacterium 13_1_20CM_2_70_10]|nr:MAG: hypothetical protein AUG10_06920 [Gemmatimonadetes bacterium 13_1_20CM_2_70_10]
MLRCPEPHREEFLVLSTGEMLGRMVRAGVVGCPVCQKEYEIAAGVVYFGGRGKGDGAAATREPTTDAQTLQALLDLGGPGGYVVLLGSAARHAVGLAAVMGGIHFIGVNPPPGLEELPVLSLLVCERTIPLRDAMARGVVVGNESSGAAWLAESRRVLLPGRRLVIENETARPDGVTQLATGQGLFVGEKK